MCGNLGGGSKGSKSGGGSLQRLEHQQTLQWRELREEYRDTTPPKKVTNEDLTKAQRAKFYEAKDAFEDGDKDLTPLENANPKTVKAIFQAANYDYYKALERVQNTSPTVDKYSLKLANRRNENKGKTDFQIAMEEYKFKRKFVNAIAVFASDHNIDTFSEREITSTTYKRAQNGLNKQIEDRFKR